MDSHPNLGKLAALAAAIAAGVFIGLFTFNLYERYQLRNDLEAISEGIREFSGSIDASIREATRESRERASARAEAISRQRQMTQDRVRAGRERSETGQMLARRCFEWQQANLEFNSISSREGEQQACRDFESYVSTGRLPPSS